MRDEGHPARLRGERILRIVEPTRKKSFLQTRRDQARPAEGEGGREQRQGRRTRAWRTMGQLPKAVTQHRDTIRFPHKHPGSCMEGEVGTLEALETYVQSCLGGHFPHVDSLQN